MRRTTTIALMAAALAAAPLAGSATAEQGAIKDEGAVQSRPAGSAGLMRSDDIVGSEVRDASGEELGSVDGLMIGADGKVQAAILSLGGVLGVGDKKVEVPWDSLQVKHQADDPGELVVTASRKAIESAPAYEEPGLLGGTAARDAAGGAEERDERSARMPAAGNVE